tara:strand:+ start:1425 stop:2114 length:690 start_codon:yes stop_codon:yes gene_type:complete
MASNILNIDDHYLHFPKEGWGWTDLNNKDLIEGFQRVNEIVRPKNVIEIGMFAGHATLLMFHVFNEIQSITSYDPIKVAQTNHRQIKKYYNHIYYPDVIWNNESRHKDIDLIFVDGNHIDEAPVKDLKSCIKIRPRYILVDNIEQPSVRGATKRHFKLWDTRFEPEYFFYTNIKYAKSVKANLKSPGIMGLFKMEGNYDNNEDIWNNEAGQGYAWEAIADPEAEPADIT